MLKFKKTLFFRNFEVEGGREGKGKRHFLSIKKQKNIWIFNQALIIVSKENKQKQKNI